VKDKGIKNVFSEIVNFENRHNTHQKPYKMTKKIIKQLTNKGDLVIDPCAGGFGVLLACQNLKRNFLGTDLSLRKLVKFNINRENSRILLNKEKL
jgi:DNA modification methylase